ncbi:MAG TPA: hypothetical protein VK760_03630 [Candidatus Acidoferrales bacterium]|jgi:hypothetical protein|nr:hypothetical protein [Candidatus Acidoferrales bacterium]
MRILRFGIAALALVATVATAACGGLTKSPADGLTFKAPTDWASSPGIMGMMQFWTSADKKQVLMLFRVPADFKTDQAFNSAEVKDAHIESQKPVKVCGSQDAEYTKAIATSSRTGDDNNLEMVSTKNADGVLMGMYIYPIGTKPDAAADAAIYQLCPAKS